ncbi:MAG: DUF6588 family protein [Gemmatimonadota bacterium]
MREPLRNHSLARRPRGAAPTALVAAALTLGSLIARPARAQDIAGSLETLGVENAKLYVGPVTNGLAAAMNSGLFHTARVHAPLGFDIGVRAIGAVVPNADDTFVPVLPASVDFMGVTYTSPYGPAGGSALLSPTAVGKGPGLVLQPQGSFRQAIVTAGQSPSSFDIALPEGFDFPLVPYGAIQGSLGLILGTEATVRFIPSIEISQDVGSVEMFGFGLKHSIDQWFPVPSPINIAVAYAHQELDVGTYLDASADEFSLIVSKDFPVLTLYAAGTIEDASLDVTYTVANTAGIPGVPANGTRIAFTADSPNNGRLTLGFTLNLGLLKLNGDYAVADQNVASAGLFIGLR